MSGALLDRIDLGVEVPALAPAALAIRTASHERTAEAGTTNGPVRAQVMASRARQIERQGKPNARLSPREIEARAYHRILKVARTIADLADCDEIAAPHVAEAVAYRRFDRI